MDGERGEPETSVATTASQSDATTMDSTWRGLAQRFWIWNSRFRPFNSPYAVMRGDRRRAQAYRPSRHRDRRAAIQNPVLVAATV